jgi:putative resolvase
MLPVPAERVGGLILVRADAPVSSAAGAVLYARVSSDDRRADLGAPGAWLSGWASEQVRVVAPGRL